MNNKFKKIFKIALLPFTALACAISFVVASPNTYAYSLDTSGNLISDNLWSLNNSYSLSSSGWILINSFNLLSGTYTISYDSLSSSGATSFALYDSDSNVVSSVQINNNVGYATFTINVDIVLIQWYSNIATTYSNIMLNRGITPLPYEPYGQTFYSQQNYDYYGWERELYGEEIGYNSGLDDGYENGFAEGSEQGYNNGWDAGVDYVSNVSIWDSVHHIYLQSVVSPNAIGMNNQVLWDSVFSVQMKEEYISSGNFAFNEFASDFFLDTYASDLRYYQMHFAFGNSDLYKRPLATKDTKFDFIFKDLVPNCIMFVRYDDGIIDTYFFTDYVENEHSIITPRELNYGKEITDIYFTNVNDQSGSLLTLSNGFNYGAYTSGFNNGFNSGKYVGYNEGFKKGKDVGILEGADNGGFGLLNVFNAVVSSPVNMFKEMFDVEFFGVNIGGFVISIIAILVVSWLIKLFL